MKKIESALAHAKAGWPIIPCHTVVEGECSCGKKTETWWRKWPDANVAGRCDGLAVVDVDVRDEKQGLKTLEDLEDEHGEIERVLVQRTGSGGLHIVTAAREGVKYPKGLGRDVDVKAGSGAYIMLPGSAHESGGTYEWEEGDGTDPDFYENIPLASKWFSAAKAETEKEPAKTSSDDNRTAMSNMVKRRTLGLTEDQAWSHLLDLDFDKWCDSRNGEGERNSGWVTVGMALHHEFEASDVGLQLWKDFSEKSEKYDEDDLERVWKSFNENRDHRPVRFATIVEAGRHKRFKRKHTGADIDDPLDKPGAEDDDPDGWLDSLDLDKQGEVKPTSYNVSLIIQNDVRVKGIFGYNQFIGDACVVKKPGKRIAKNEKRQARMVQLNSWIWNLDPLQAREGRPIEDDHLDSIRVCLESPAKSGGYGVKVSDRDLRAAISVASNNNPYHPVQAWLETLTWDGEKRMDYLFVDYLGTHDDEYHRQTARLWMIAGVARAYQPGHKFDFVPILEGKQGTRKSTFIERLAKFWFVELRCDFSDPKKVVETLIGSWVAEIPELQQFSKAEVAEIKAFFSAKEEKVREAYGRKSKYFKRQSIYMGTTNDREYLRDPTGNRRFWPIQCSTGLIDTDKLKKNVEQLWAEAVHEYKHMLKDHPGGALPLYLRGDEANKIALELQESRMVETQAQGWAGMISTWANTKVHKSALEGLDERFDKFDGPDPLMQRDKICALQVWVEVLKGTTESYGRGNSLKVIEAIRATGEWTEIGLQRLPVYGPQRCFGRIAKRARSADDLLA